MALTLIHLFNCWINVWIQFCLESRFTSCHIANTLQERIVLADLKAHSGVFMCFLFSVRHQNALCVECIPFLIKHLQIPISFNVLNCAFFFYFLFFTMFLCLLANSLLLSLCWSIALYHSPQLSITGIMWNQHVSTTIVWIVMKFGTGTHVWHFL